VQRRQALKIEPRVSDKDMVEMEKIFAEQQKAKIEKEFKVLQKL
jgi:hypothetical protein